MLAEREVVEGFTHGADDASTRIAALVAIDFAGGHSRAAERADIGFDIPVADFTEIGIGVYRTAAVGAGSHFQRVSAGGAEHRLLVVHGATGGAGDALGLVLPVLCFGTHFGCGFPDQFFPLHRACVEVGTTGFYSNIFGHHIGCLNL